MDLKTWQDVFILLIMGLVLLFGAPIIQLIKNLLSKIFKTTIEDRWAVALAVVIAVGLALLEMWLDGMLTGLVLTPATFPEFLGVVYGVAQVYYGWFKKSATAFGTASLLKTVDPVSPVSQGGTTDKVS
jgi:hypothetical protein